MTLRTINCARFVRDGGIDAMAALNDALRDAIAGLDAPAQLDLKRLFGEVMDEISVKLINPAVRAFPELKPDKMTWVSVAQARATARSNAV